MFKTRYFLEEKKKKLGRKKLNNEKIRIPKIVWLQRAKDSRLPLSSKKVKVLLTNITKN